jgi:hypothetical protein
MLYFIDTEFVERPGTIDLMSVALVAEDGRELYVINGRCDLSRASKWVMRHVVRRMPEHDPQTNAFRRMPHVMTPARMKAAVKAFVGRDRHPEFWGYHGAYDWVVFCWLFGRMTARPKHFPKYCRDLKQEMDRLRVGKRHLPCNRNRHDALADARWIRDSYFIVKEME